MAVPTHEDTQDEVRLEDRHRARGAAPERAGRAHDVPGPGGAVGQGVAREEEDDAA